MILANKNPKLCTFVITKLSNNKMKIHADKQNNLIEKKKTRKNHGMRIKAIKKEKIFKACKTNKIISHY